MYVWVAIFSVGVCVCVYVWVAVFCVCVCVGCWFLSVYVCVCGCMCGLLFSLRVCGGVAVFSVCVYVWVAVFCVCVCLSYPEFRTQHMLPLKGTKACTILCDSTKIDYRQLKVNRDLLYCKKQCILLWLDELFEESHVMLGRYTSL